MKFRFDSVALPLPIAALALALTSCTSSPPVIDNFAGLPPVEMRAAEGRFEKIPADMSKAGTNDIVHDTYRIEYPDCAIELVVETPKRGGNRSLRLEDGCPRELGQHRDATYDYLLHSVATDFPRDTITALYSSSFYQLGLWNEAVALQSLKSPAWQKYKRDLKKGYVYPNSYFVELFREARAGAEILGALKKNGWTGELASVEKVMMGKPGQLPFAKRHPEIAKANPKESLPFSAGIYNFRLDGRKAR